MTVDTLIDELRRKGVTLECRGEKLRIRGPAPVVIAVEDDLRVRKSEILAALGQVWARKAASLLATITDDGLRADLRYQFEERAAICEHGGGICRDEAERMAFHEMSAAMAELGGDHE